MQERRNSSALAISSGLYLQNDHPHPRKCPNDFRPYVSLP